MGGISQLLDGFDSPDTWLTGTAKFVSFSTEAVYPPATVKSIRYCPWLDFQLRRWWTVIHGVIENAPRRSRIARANQVINSALVQLRAERFTLPMPDLPNLRRRSAPEEARRKGLWAVS